MKSLTKTLLVLIATVFGIASVTEAQSPRDIAMELQRVRQQFSHLGTTPSRMTSGVQTQQRQHQPTNRHLGTPRNPVARHNVYPTYPQYPVYVTPDQYNGINPYTGGINTKNEQVDNTYYDRHREASRNNGTRRWVRRPIYDVHGNVKGYQEGYVWNNSVTGVEHGELKNVTDNNKGGVHEQIQVKSL